MSLLQFQNVSYTNNKSILSDISIDINAGDFISIVGPSGSGKSTLLKLCCHLISPSSGNILYMGRCIMEYNPTDIRKSIAYCFQTPYLFGDTVMDNIAFPFAIRDIPVDIEKANELLLSFKLDKDYLNREIKNLSGGEKQRISLIRTLLFKPGILLLDEITSALDVENTIIVEEAIASLNENGITILWITHNPEQSRKYANKVLTLNNGMIKSLEVL